MQTQIATILTVDNQATYSHILRDFIDVTRDLVPKKPTHTIQHHIVTKGPPVSEKARRLSPDKLKAAKQQFQHMLEQGICVPSSSPWASSIHLVTKKDGSWRICGDYRRLNSVTLTDKYSLPHIHDFVYAFRGCKVFTTLDLRRAYNQVPVAPEDIEKTAVITPFGLYEFTVMTFGLCNAAQTFQRFMDTVLRGLSFCHCYIDDIIIASQDEEQHKQHLRMVLERLQSYGLSINVAKCKLGKEKVEYLGHFIDSNGLKPLEEKVEAIRNFPVPKDVSELRRFLGMINFYRRFLPGAAGKQKLLTDYMKGAKKKDKRKIVWTKEALKACEELKEMLMNVSLLAYPQDDAPLVLTTDASNHAIGAVLEQVTHKGREPLGFFSTKLAETQAVQCV